jgi:tellurite methyltransferase
MLINYDDLYCYKKTKIDSQNKLKFFLEKHSTKEGTWGLLRLHSGAINFIFLDGKEKELSRHRIDTNNSELHIPPALWHKIEPESERFTATLEFYCQPHRYFKKKYDLGSVHSDLYYVYKTYLKEKRDLNILDVGCGQGRNLLLLALLGHQLTGIDIKAASIHKVEEIAQKENLSNIKTILHDLHQPLSLQKESYDLVASVVSLQFLEPNRIHALLTELQLTTTIEGLHFLVFPIKAEPYSLPSSFTYLPKSKELYDFYQDSGWSILEYKESVGQLHKLDNSGKPIQGLFGFLLAQKSKQSFGRI